jgi:hypothetical protein
LADDDRLDRDDRATVLLIDTAERRVHAQIELERAGQRCDARLAGESPVVFDGHGRLLVVSLASGAVVRELRLP